MSSSEVTSPRSSKSESSVLHRSPVFHTGFLAWGGGGGIYWCINEARKCERRGLGASPSQPPPAIF